MTTFLDSSLRRLIFPYLEGADDEDPRQPHWMSNLAREALGAESSYRFSPSSSTSSTNTKRSTDSRTLAASASKRHFIAADSADPGGHHYSVYDTPWTVAYINQHKTSYHWDDAASDQDSDVEAPTSRSQPRQHAKLTARPNRSGSAPADLTLAEEERQSSIAPVPTASSSSSSSTSVEPVASSSAVRGPPRSRSSTAPESCSSPRLTASDDDDSKSKVRGRQPHRRRRQLSVGQTLAPAQPLPQVNTMLPLKLPPMQLRARETDPTVVISEKTFGARAVASCSNIAKTRSFLPLQTSTSSASLSSNSSDGSYHGDAGDFDPEEQLAAKVATLSDNGVTVAESTTAGQVQGVASLPSSTSSSAVIVEPTPSNGPASVPLSATAEDPTSGEIAQYAGIFGSLADMLLELKIVRRGPSNLRTRASSEAALMDADAASKATSTSSTTTLSHNPRSQSVDAVDERMSTYEKQHMMSSFDKSTPSSLRAEVKAWSRNRQRERVRTAPNTTTTTYVTSTTSSAPSSKDTTTTHPSSSFIRGLLSRASSLRDLLDLEQTAFNGGVSLDDVDVDFDTSADADDEAEADAEGEGDMCPTPVSASDVSSSEEDDDEDDEAAYHSLWASPIVSRSSSQYNLRLHSSDEPTAFEQETSAKAVKGLWEGATAAFLRQEDKKPTRSTSDGSSMSKISKNKNKNSALRPLTTMPTTTATTTTTTTLDATEVSSPKVLYGF